MDFARKQLEKYGWTDGKGLGKQENGIAEPLKPKLKRSVAGVGHDAASDFTEHWWSQLYNKAAKNVEVEEKNGKTKRIKTKDDQFKITNSSYHLSKKSDVNQSQEEYADFFVKTAVLTSGGSKMEAVRGSETKHEEKTEVFKLTDDELFAACEGRTAHKGARHGLKALGKLARIERQEQMLLSEVKYSGYSHTKKTNDQKNSSEMDLDVVEHTNLGEEGFNAIKKKKKKRKRCISNASVEAMHVSIDNSDSDAKNNNNKNKLKSNTKDLAASTSMPLPEEQDVEMAGNVKEKRNKKSKRKDLEMNTEEQFADVDLPNNMLDSELIDGDLKQDAQKKLKKKKKRRLI